MTTIREIAEEAELSISTVSFIINGKGDEMRISKATQKKVLNIAAELGYHPSISARRLRQSEYKNTPIINVLWTLDTRTGLLSRFLQGIQNEYLHGDQPFELLVQPYENGKIKEVSGLFTGSNYNGAIITNASNEDLEYLEQSDLNVPIVIYQRYSEKYNNVIVDSKKTGYEVAKFLAEKGHKKVGLVIPNISSQAVDLRREGFLKGIKEFGLENSLELHGDFNEKGGYEVIEYLHKEACAKITALFFLSDPMAVGAIAACHEFGIKIPQDIEIIGHDNDEQTAYTSPSLTTVNLPVEKMANACIKLMLDMINHKVGQNTSIHFETNLVIRNSCKDEQ